MPDKVVEVKNAKAQEKPENSENLAVSNGEIAPVVGENDESPVV